MKNIIFLLVCTFLSISTKAQSYMGAWERYHTSEEGEKLKSVVIFADGYQVLTTYQAETGKFMSTNGGTWKLEGDTMTEKVEFDTDNPERVGSEVSFKVTNNGTVLSIVGQDMDMKRIDDGTPGALQGAWLMSGRMRDGKEETRDTSGPRKTMKILSGTRFQWIAYNTETKQFSGTGGGTYTTEDGKYTENIEFFSRDDSRVGMSLSFDYSLVDGKWHHKGLSSTGNPIHEIWSLRAK
ncbi:membrane or secreted protein [Confluentibacter flavum]|uniref:Membrane or secreted protein n=1 Tax=Confluentibacter flavum TaxID=1909700 RepID=A0A2N3HN02_9FLAO|nr:membrane or secreted protein [Confluentibacter flavum]PKQ46244.1 membrane or secreted protein [Confluentibacter flavum]